MNIKNVIQKWDDHAIYISNNGMVHWIIMAYNLHPTPSNITQPTARNTYRLECSFMPHVKA